MGVSLIPKLTKESAAKYRIENLGTVFFEGFNRDPAAADTDSSWLIKRTSIAGSNTLIEEALQGFETAQWTQRTTYFGAVPFANTYSALFDGTNDSVRVPHNALLNLPRLTPWSIMLWAKTLAPTSAGTLIEKFTGGFGLTLDHDSSGRVTINYQGGGTGNRIRVREDAAMFGAEGAWRNIIITYDGSSSAAGMRIYFDNTEAGRNVLNDTLTVNPDNLAEWAIGSSSTGGTPRFSGFIDSVSIWSGVSLDANNRTALYTAAAKQDIRNNFGNYTQSASLQNWWRMGDNDTYPIILDQKGGLNATMYNMTPGNFVKEVP